MSDQGNLQPELRRRANEQLRRLSSSEREALLVRCWMSHDARWFMAVAREFGIEAANRINQTAVRELGEVEAKHLIRALRLPPVKGIEDLLLAQEIIIGLFGPDLLDYDLAKVGENKCQVRVRRCFAHENAKRAGIGDQFECGIFARSSGWMKALGVVYEMTPPPGKCLKVQGQECEYTFKLMIRPNR